MDRDAVARRVSGAMMRIRAGAPFFGALLLFARFLPTDAIPTAATDGRDVYYNPAFLARLPSGELDAVLLHEVLHAALRHGARRGPREKMRWNFAADVVVNGILAAQPGMKLPAEAIRMPSMEHLDVEEVYRLLESRVVTIEVVTCLDLHPEPHGHGGPKTGQGPILSPKALAELEAHWEFVLRQAAAVARATARGSLPAGIERLLRRQADPQIDWRTQLWRFLARTPTDFGDFDRRFVHRGLYLESLTGESLRAFIAVDTSGSVDDDLLSRFTAEVQGVLRAYPHVHAELYYADAALYGPFELTADSPLPPLVGGGGTRFEPFFEHVERASAEHGESVLIYLTDGHGSFPATPPSAPVLWVVPPGGAPDEAFPFGSVVRLVD